MKPCRKFCLPMRNILYIPHGSDETSLIWYIFLSWTCLYIPHGSDETPEFPYHTSINTAFISHMVQMKHIYILWYCDMPHITLYPTWFRWNAGEKNFSYSYKNLYIPHGSDETSIWGLLCTIERRPLYPTWFRWNMFIFAVPLAIFTFISHMVQMKLKSNTCWDSLYFSLYPTWFRWNKEVKPLKV